MSGTAALAAAKRRRNLNDSQPITGSKSQMEQPTVTRPSTEPVHPLQTLLTHDKQIFLLEKRFEQLEQAIPNMANMANMNNGAEISDELDSLVRNNNSEVKLLKLALQKMQKQIQDLNSVVTTLRGSISNHDGVINDLIEKITNTNLSGLSSVYETSEEDKDSNIELNITNS
jgi:chromosome condensin MukBEF ATPase and DNA-binding subunit MukB